MLGGRADSLRIAYGAGASDRRSVGAWTERAPNRRGREGVKKLETRAAPVFEKDKPASDLVKNLHYGVRYKVCALVYATSLYDRASASRLPSAEGA